MNREKEGQDQHQEITASPTETHVSHEVSLAAEKVGDFFNWPVTNSLINSWLVVLLLVALSLALRAKMKLIPRGLQNIMETILEGALSLADSVTHSRAKTLKIFPIVISLFFFIIINNWLGLLPGIGSVGLLEHTAHGEVFVPYFRGGTADLNTTLALALIAVIGSNLFGVFSVGIWKYFNKFINLKALAEIPGKFIKEPSVIIVNPIKFFVGLIEIIGEIAKVASLSFRLFGNIFAGEVLLTSIAAIFAFVLPLPFMFLEVIVGIIQALIFSMLTLVYFSIASAEEH